MAKKKNINCLDGVPLTFDDVDDGLIQANMMSPTYGNQQWQSIRPVNAKNSNSIVYSTQFRKEKCIAAGLIIFSRDGLQVCLVEANYGRYDHGFPKGMIDGGEGRRRGALRETKEETGLTVNDLVFVIPRHVFDEGNDCYFAAAVTRASYEYRFQYNTHELRSVQWYSIAQALNLPKFNSKRRQLLLQALNIYMDALKRNQLITGEAFKNYQL
ncbi:unnamed protein product [Didymodactylos carnosus]|uniref:Nudix hydrolase domain-containing protein n=1 Tax=Didymodactylos carnosus TaxID=1234261 RepID=A0A815MUY2_9BILA|nr:unnamed protein product [Didymodactylos carnosus]CAF1424695.1 unnamed protein product [Didymodactylos carnosus]CAF3694407.1 unnamed protein product [Didymodactylos carnosus]CAF4305916.1 unnamed protein product [Didymodactylos carnosus]